MSRLIDNIVTRALESACGKENITDRELVWEGENAPKPYSHPDAHDVQVLYIGGGNAFVSFCCEDMCIKINKHMAKYIIEKTYSLQLATAYVEMTDNCANDYKAIYEKMGQVKAEMNVSKPLGALPVMETELRTGSRQELREDEQGNVPEKVHKGQRD